MKKISLYLLLAALAVQAENWPQLRGPGGRGISSDKGFPVKWTTKDYFLNSHWKMIDTESTRDSRNCPTPITDGIHTGVGYLKKYKELFLILNY